MSVLHPLYASKTDIFSMMYNPATCTFMCDLELECDLRTELTRMLNFLQTALLGTNLEIAVCG